MAGCGCVCVFLYVCSNRLTFPTVGGAIRAAIMLRGKIAVRSRNRIEAQQNSRKVKTKTQQSNIAERVMVSLTALKGSFIETPRPRRMDLLQQQQHT